MATQNIIESQDVPHKRTGVVNKRIQQVVGILKICHARIYGSKEIVTAVVYEGSKFEKASQIPLVLGYLHNLEFLQHRAHAEWREEFR